MSPQPTEAAIRTLTNDTVIRLKATYTAFFWLALVLIATAGAELGTLTTPVDGKTLVLSFITASFAALLLVVRRWVLRSTETAVWCLYNELASQPTAIETLRSLKLSDIADDPDFKNGFEAGVNNRPPQKWSLLYMKGHREGCLRAPRRNDTFLNR